MIAAEDDHGPLQRTHSDGSGSQVPNHEDIYLLLFIYLIHSWTQCK